MPWSDLLLMYSQANLGFLTLAEVGSQESKQNLTDNQSLSSIISLFFSTESFHMHTIGLQ